ncbi:multidrug efflux system outer membrane protein [Gibbsiella quercinecans]|uniref:Multidrug transporter n=1 Tax=Gibbsiella quercinecans TaxID=929813 RepID=A0A250AWE7_9GAMM|nr:efflux transporter outer membrane subunit [Gibbsiella quercinecans]ATA18257.1 multidrug transporter [Gibbsiella quercinecans]RLM12982.1 multidrug transporter [Gibbsiella quercinecans]RLM14532.1 multidrug transporter [Gibbsiella quercinecans]TCT90833.1 multidrug efflux system outer membrane protein [Gibbsiella quercinecans]
MFHHKNVFHLSIISLSLLLAGCVSLDPHYERPAAPVPQTWLTQGNNSDAKTVLSDWQQVLADPRLNKVVERALVSNRDLQKAIADIEAARALYGEERAALFPTLDAELTQTRSRTASEGVSSSAEADGAISSFELDLFGRNRSLARAAKETWLASEATAQNTRITLVAETTTAWITLAADKSNLALSQQTMASAADTLRITQRQLGVGTASAADVSEAETTYQQARASVASDKTLVAQDINALNLLVGETVPENLLPGPIENLAPQAIALVPAGVSSTVLLRRPDVIEAEHNLKSENADIGAARANFFPTISLTASAGVGSSSLSNLFSHGTNVWSFAPSITLPLFAGGSNLAQLHYAEAEKKGLIATYQKTIQTAFEDVANALARRETLNEQMDAQVQAVASAQRSYDIARRSYEVGTGDYLTVLTDQRTLWSTQLDLVALQQTDFENRITLWESLGGGVK